MLARIVCDCAYDDVRIDYRIGVPVSRPYFDACPDLLL